MLSVTPHVLGAPFSPTKTLGNDNSDSFWGYQIEGTNIDDEFTKVLIDAPQTEDTSDL